MRKLMEKMTGKITVKELKKKAAYLLSGFSILFMSVCVQVGATSSVTGPINKIKDLVLDIVTAIGAIVLIWGIFDFASGYQHHDSSQQTQSMKKIVAGLIMAAAGKIIPMLT